MSVRMWSQVYKSGCVNSHNVQEERKSVSNSSRLQQQDVCTICPSCVVNTSWCFTSEWSKNASNDDKACRSDEGCAPDVDPSDPGTSFVRRGGLRATPAKLQIFPQKYTSREKPVPQFLLSYVLFIQKSVSSFVWEYIKRGEFHQQPPCLNVCYARNPRQNMPD